MNLIPTWPFVVGALAIGGAGGFAIEHTIKSAEIAAIKLVNANEITAASQVALSDYQLAAKKINEAAGGARVDFDAVLVKLSAIDRRYRNAKPPPLPADCKPDTARVQRLTDAARIADEAIARPITGH